MALEGTLHDMPLADLFEIFRMGNKSGILRIFSPGKESAIYVTMGRLIDATVYDAITRQLVVRGDDAVLQMLQWDTAEFTFTHDLSTVRHPVTIFYEIEQLVRFSAELPRPIGPAAQPLNNAMSLSANLAFLHELGPTAYTESYRRSGTLSTADDSSMPNQSAASQVYRLDLVPPADDVQDVQSVVPAEPTMPAPSVLYERVAGQECIAAQTPQPILPPRAVVSSAGRKLLAAVLRRVRAL